MTKNEELETRIRIANLFEIPPDDIYPFDADEDIEEKLHFFSVPYMGATITFGFKEAPTSHDLVEEIRSVVEAVESWLEEEEPFM